MRTLGTISVVTLILGLPFDGRGQDHTNASTPPVIIEISGGFGHLTSMQLRADGTFTWHGWEPGRRIVSIRHGKLDADELRMIVGVAGRVRQTVTGSELAGGDRSYTLVLRGPDGRKQEIGIRHAKQDQRPAEVRQLLNLLWATRNRPEKPSERSGQVSPANQPEPSGLGRSGSP